MSNFPSAAPNTDRFQRTPLKRFRGILKEMPALVKNEQNNRQKAVFNFTDITVLESDEPYLFPIAVIEIPYNPEGKNNSWDVFTTSVRQQFTDANYDTMFERMVGKEVEFWYGDCEIRRPGDEGSGEDDASVRSNWKLRPSKAWQVTYVAGNTPATGSNGKGLNEALADLLDGKTRIEFQSALFSSESSHLKNTYGSEYNKAVEAASHQTLLPALEALGLVTVDSNGTYHKVEK